MQAISMTDRLNSRVRAVMREKTVTAKNGRVTTSYELIDVLDEGQAVPVIQQDETPA
jgi:hypothetical protein